MSAGGSVHDVAHKMYIEKPRSLCIARTATSFKTGAVSLTSIQTMDPPTKVASNQKKYLSAIVRSNIAWMLNEYADKGFFSPYVAISREHRIHIANKSLVALRHFGELIPNLPDEIWNEIKSRKHESCESFSSLETFQLLNLSRTCYCRQRKPIDRKAVCCFTMISWPI